ncbi:GPI mannosyltransferase 1 [Neodiprion fabricii]|uniref:GPI mannosyltransferase 1 n=1 Tax=Neodiprion fabricii TaxID=2872261 RepID=UPI001ED943B0|nr:GPI mannosyltransferase 1 [Neodiprion fabricii]
MGDKRYAIHCCAALAARLVLVAYSNFHDKNFNVSYTDVDYKVFTDAARHITEGNSPYDRDTYRYTPFIAMILIPNVIICQEFGKIVFSFFDILISILIRQILLGQKFNDKTSSFCSFLWLYNPLAMVISTRGNADSLAVFFVLLVAYYLQKDNYWLAGIVHGFSIHLRLYPLAFSLAMYLALRKSSGLIIVPNKKQVALVLSCVLSLLTWTSLSYYFYGYKFLYESLLYHLIRKDARHNFSVYFYMLYLSANNDPGIWQRAFTFLPQLILLIGLSFSYSSKQNLFFSMLTQAIVMVTYNPVMTSQYFFWFLSLLPVCLPRLKMSISRCVVLTSAWIIAQSIWLFAAYLLEFKGFNSFIYIWLAGLLFFIVNIKVLIDVMNSYHSTMDVEKSQ